MATSADSPPTDQKIEPGGKTGKGHIAPRVFYPSAAIILAFVALTVIFPSQAEEIIGTVQGSIVDGFGWYYVALVSGFVVFSLWVGIGHFGDIKLGKDDEEPEFSLASWLAMLFAAGMGIGLVFWGVAEPLNHFASPKPGVEGTPEQVGQQSLVQTFLHWGLHPWAIYVVVGLAIAYAVHRKGRPVSIRWALEPLLGDRVKGRWGDVIDVVAVVGTLFGVATSLGFGVLQVAAGLDFVGIDGVADSTPALILLIGGITAMAIFSVVSGVKKGVKWLSNINMSMAAILMLFVLIAGPTLFLLREFVQSIGLYLQNLLQMSFDVSAMQGEEGAAWQAAWATFYWGWWISWAPFVGIFIARISRGRTVREFVAGVLLVPTVITFLWFTIFGGTGLYRELFGEGGLVVDGAVNTEGALFGVLGDLPGGMIVSVFAIVLIVLFFVTSSDSGSLVVDMLTSGGNPEPPTWSRVFWSVVEGLVAIALLVVGGDSGLAALQTTAIVIAFPFSIIMIGMCVATWRQFHEERESWLRARRKRQREELTEHISQTLIEDGYIEEPDRSDEGASASSTEPKPASGKA
ncbi:BCCT family transporter [Actinoalloteichus sp. AHMU CJ021]|uniref:Choline/glycine/proline betaine transport protein n=1 Tax=Actinoalloteichus caeruleus DSM 43889 TaxID=1120930 RepID=A0ABT1JGB4_ACTCY|nr:BCCT family transporter [Actinoalloteichus sp. AHMU CJ021]MCP2331539.1 choline/glycine/proline betaine transport protein [Actinoalloteichus caeruleus DSM 43889]